MAGQGNEEDVCAICSAATRDELEAAGGLGVLSCCDHWYCADCILPWLTRRSSTCPTCRQQVDWMAAVAAGYRPRRVEKALLAAPRAEVARIVDDPGAFVAAACGATAARVELRPAKRARAS